MMELPMTSLHPNLKPAILLKQRDEVANLHVRILLRGRLQSRTTICMQFLNNNKPVR
jgi:hypothetical protein